MNAQELAALLDGRSYRKETTHAERMEARDAGLVIVYGASDDLIEFEGAIDDEGDCYEGGTFGFERDGKGFRIVSLVDPDAHDGSKIFARWCPEGSLSWAYVTDLPHSTFTIYEDGEPYCRGLVFALADITPVS